MSHPAPACSIMNTPGHLRAQHLPHNGVYASHSETTPDARKSRTSPSTHIPPRTILCIEEVIVVACRAEKGACREDDSLENVGISQIFFDDRHARSGGTPAGDERVVRRMIVMLKV